MGTVQKRGMAALQEGVNIWQCISVGTRALGGLDWMPAWRGVKQSAEAALLFKHRARWWVKGMLGLSVSCSVGTAWR